MNLSELAGLVGRAPVRSEFTCLLVLLDKEFTAGQPTEPWEHHYARRLVEHVAA